MVSKGTLRNIARESGICAGRFADHACRHALVSIIMSLLLASISEIILPILIVCSDHLFPDDSPVHSSPLRSRSLTNSPNHAHHLRHHSVESRDSMVIVQFVDNGDYDIGDNEKHENGYDKLLPPGEFEHLCTCTYGRVTTAKEAAKNSSRSAAVRRSSLSDSQDEHFTTVRM